jgi:predicted membrane channel-forming protein YqfA (hemolysin III family)
VTPGGRRRSTFLFGTFVSRLAYPVTADVEEETMDGLIYLIGLIVIIMAILSFFGLR